MDWRAAVVGVAVMIAFGVISSAIRAVAEVMRGTEKGEEEGPSTLGP